MKYRSQVSVSVLAGCLLLLLVVEVLSSDLRRSRTLTSASIEQLSNRTTTEQAFLVDLVATRTPGGLVPLVKCRGDEPTFSHDPPSTDLHKSLNLLIKTDPRYTWRDDNRVINLLPSTGEPELLKTHVRHFAVDLSLNEALRQLLTSTDVAQAATRLQLKRTSLKLVMGPSPFSNGPARVKLDLSDISLRTALNALVRSHGRAVWEYREYRCGGTNEFSVDFVAQ